MLSDLKAKHDKIDFADFFVNEDAEFRMADKTIAAAEDLNSTADNGLEETIEKNTIGS